MNRQEKIQIAILILIAMAIITMILAIKALIQRSEIIKNNPIEYTINNSELESCTCYDSNGLVYNFGEDKFGELLWDKQT